MRELEESPGIVVETLDLSGTVTTLADLVSRPEKVTVKVQNGQVTIRGIVQDNEISPLVDCLRRIKGFRAQTITCKYFSVSK